MKPRQVASDLAGGIVILAAVFAALYPLYWLVQLSLKAPVEAMRFPPAFLFIPTFDNYLNLFVRHSFGRYFLNSIIVSALSLTLSLAVGCPGAFGLSRIRFRGKRLLVLSILITRIAPGIMFVIPYFLFFMKVGLLDSRLALVLLYVTRNLSLVAWTMSVFFSTVPVTLDESARMDGATAFQVFRKIVLPLSVPGLVTTSIMCFITSWNEFLYALVIGRRRAMTAPVAVVQFMAYEGTEWGYIAAGSVLVLIPVVLLSLFIRKYFVRGLMRGYAK